MRYHFLADGEYQFEMRPKESGAGGGFEGITAEPHELARGHRRRQGLVGHAGRAGVRAQSPGRSRSDGRLSARRSHQEDSDSAHVPRAGESGPAHGAGLLRRQDIGLRRRPVRSFTAPRSVPRRWRRAKGVELDDYRTDARNGGGRRYARAGGGFSPASRSLRRTRRAPRRSSPRSHAAPTAGR